MEKNKIKNLSLSLLWAGAAISISEIYTGSIVAPLGFTKGLITILLGHLIGCLLLAFGGYISFASGKSAMEKVRDALGAGGVKVIAFLNVLQLLGWGAVMIIQGGRAFGGIFNLSLPLAMAFMGIAVFAWAYFFNNFSKGINDILVIILLIVSIVVLFKVNFTLTPALQGDISFWTAVELSIAMPVSWLPLIGDYTRNGESKGGVLFGTFIGYFLASSLMYILGLLITIHSGMDVIEYIVNSNLKVVAGFIIVASTVTTTFLDIFSAVMSSKQIIAIKKDNLWIAFYSFISLAVAYRFPIENYQSFLLMIGGVFIPVYTIVFVEHLTNYQGQGAKLNTIGLILALIGTALYTYLTNIGWGSPTVAVLIFTSGMYFMIKRFVLGVRDTGMLTTKKAG